MDRLALIAWLKQRIGEAERAFVESGRDAAHHGGAEAFKMTLVAVESGQFG